VTLELSLPCDVFGDDLVGFQLALFGEHFSSLSRTLRIAWSSAPFYFEGIDAGSVRD